MTFKKFMHSVIAKILFSFFAVATPFVWMMSNEFHYFFDLFKGLSYIVLFVTILLAVYELVYIYFDEIQKPLSKKGFEIAYYVCCFLGVVLFVGALTIISLLAPQMSRNVFIKELPYIIITLIVLLLLFLSTKKNAVILPSVAVGILAVMLIFAVIVPVSNGTIFKFDATPSVFDRGDCYLVVWADSQNSVGRIEYSYDGNDYVLYDELAGRINLSERIHSISVPKAHLDNNEYTVRSSRVTKNVAYGSSTREEITFSATFKPVKTDTYDMTVITDNHNMPKSWYKRITEHNTDVLVMLGDFADMISDEQTIIDSLLYPSGLLSKGSAPVLYVKGNHDNRGEKANELARIFRTEKFYYQTTLGNRKITVLDSGESNYDDFSEYGYADFDGYREKQLDYFESIVDPAENNLIIVHNAKFAKDKEQSERFGRFVQGMNTSLVLAGHTHELAYTENYYSPDIDCFVCGGVTPEGAIKKTGYVYSTIKFDGNNAVIKSFTVKSNDPIFDKTIVLG